MTKKLIAFDLDDTLAPSKSPLPEEMADLVARLLEVAHVGIISGGRYEQFAKQVIAPVSSHSGAQVQRLHLMPTCGTQYYRFRNGQWERVYAEDLTDAEKQEAIASLETQAKRLGFWPEKTWGPIIEDRGSQITYSALGQQAPIEAKSAWDPTSAKKNALRQAVQADLPDLDVHAGGTTSIDITRQGIDKAYGMRKLIDVTGIPAADMLFVGDRLDPDGNDYPVKAMGIDTHAVTGWPDTAAFLRELIPQLGAEA
ncbi:MAG TPA: HAD-IIB family hydrolase [Pseudoclavibacter sp.]|nr:HAD-IIB family hydrolase [Pseudoclavibacter sp.]